MSYDKSKPGEEPTTDVMAFHAELGGRLRSVEREFPNREAAAKAAGVAKSTFQRWVEGKADPSFHGLVRLCANTGFDINWLATGEGSPRREAAVPVPPSPTQGGEELYGRAAERVEALYKSMGYSAGIRAIASEAARIARGIEAVGGTPDQQEFALKVAVEQLRADMLRSLKAPLDPVAGKSRA